MKKLSIVLVSLLIALVGGGMVFAGGTAEKPMGNIKVAMVVKNLGNPFFEASRDGGQAAAKELGNVELIFQGPSTPTAEGQIAIIDALIAQKVNAIAISANDVNALVPETKKAAAAGIKVISWDSGIAPEGRILHLAASGDQVIGESLVKMASELIGGSGEMAILSATSQATNQNSWIDWMKKTLAKPEYSKLTLDGVVYGDDLPDKSYREAQGLFKSYPNLKVIVAPTTVGIAAAGKALEDAGLQGKIQLTGLGLPSEMQQYIKDGTCQKMALWNPIDLGYSATYIAAELAMGKFKGAKGETLSVGRMGNMTIGDGNVVVMSQPFVFDKSNIDQFAKIY